MTNDSIQSLNDRFAIDGIARIEPGEGGLGRIVITAPAGEAHLYLHGAHLTHYQPRGQRPVLFVSSTSAFEPGKAIRGGVPICFPWFAQRQDDPEAPMHGFARTLPWELQSIEQRGDDVLVELRLISSEQTRAQWAHDFECIFHVTFGAELAMELRVRNIGDEAFSFEEALHSYFAVGDVRQIEVAGLAGASFIDKNDQGRRKTIGDEPIRFAAPFDALFENTTAACTIVDRLLGRRIHVAKEHSNTTVVWNPGSHGKHFTDLPESERHNFVCIETANARGNAITLAAGEAHGMVARVLLA